jgi:formate-dependent nitrite reductase cytochrome c552 subunit
MNLMGKWIGLGMLVVSIVFVAACDRTITYTEETTQPASCFSCHSDQNTAITAAEGQYGYSVHASGAHTYENSSGCSMCHTSEGFVRKVNGEAAMTIANPTAIHCFTCHAPHTNGNLTLRITTPQKLANGDSYDLKAGNICTACHQARRNVNTYVALDTVSLSTRWGPHHGVQGDMVIGTNGYEYSSYSYERTNHRGATDNGCLDCHFETPYGYSLGGHSFNMAYGGEAGETYNVTACAKCHDGMDEATDFDLDNVQTDVTGLIDTLEGMLISAGMLVDTDEGLLPPDGRKIASRSEPGDSAGALWNYFMAKEDRSEGVHNRAYITGLLESAIEFMQGPVSSAPAVAAGENRKTAR